MEDRKYTLVNCGKEYTTGNLPIITKNNNAYECDVDLIGNPGKDLASSESDIWQPIRCNTKRCRYFKTGAICPGVRVQIQIPLPPRL